MNRVALVAWHEFRELVWRKRFLFTLLSLPFFMLLSVLLGILSVKLTDSTRPVGYVDQAGILDASITVPLKRDREAVELIAYPSEAEAQADLDAGKLQAYYVLSADYLQTRDVKLVYNKRPGSTAQKYFMSFLQANLLKAYPSQVRERILQDPEVDVHIVGSDKIYPNGDPDLGLFIPIIVAFFFMMLVLMSVNYFIAAVTREKENRMAEIMLSTLRPAELIVGKILGLVGMTLTQLVTWGLMGVIAVLILVFNVELPPALLHVSVDWGLLALLIPLALVLYLFFAAALVFIGVLMPEAEQGQQIGGFFSLLWALPMWLIIPIAEHPDGTLALILSFVPGPSLLTFALRALNGTVPAWQIGLSLLFNALCAALMIVFTVKAFRLGMLRYGQRLRWHEVWMAVRARE